MKYSFVGEMSNKKSACRDCPVAGVITVHRFVKEVSDEMIYALEFRFSNNTIFRKGYTTLFSSTIYLELRCGEQHLKSLVGC